MHVRKVGCYLLVSETPGTDIGGIGDGFAAAH
jgi:hypothetical protein